MDKKINNMGAQLAECLHINVLNMDQPGFRTDPGGMITRNP
ncbi:hypothetical protein SAMN05216516_11052 [Izhakiella capsodis]|uniref:Uncharacterized protein n=1 Tax=Izhakiella capsodis TaxID=1367852 RepID=A0A1I4ZY93_9GAMM|nr:hypothetical protein [Izhakiella capsodis]SFN55152.1 hypothetical protein SAMN05216516_11052 [Izhakiella capsodis]